MDKRDKEGKTISKSRKSKKGAEMEENLSEKLKRGLVMVGKRGGVSTPVPSWRLHSSLSADETSIINKPPRLSARKLAATLWEFHHYKLPLDKANMSDAELAVDSRKSRRDHRHLQEKHGVMRDEGFDVSGFPRPYSPDQPDSASSLKKNIDQSLMHQNRASKCAPQLVSPTRYVSPIEVPPYNPAVTPTPFLDFRGRDGVSHYNIKSSTELLKVLNRIWSLEEQHISNIQLVKTLKSDLDHARVRIKVLVRDQEAGRHEIDELRKQFAEDNLVRKSKENDRIRSVTQSVREELVDERKLRKQSESLHRKLSRDLSEVKSSLSNALKEIERERRSRQLLEDLCDEFAKGIKSYARELHTFKQKSDEGWAEKCDHDHLILHMSESWLDERIQTKLEETKSGFVNKKSIVDKFEFEIENFLQAKEMGTLVSKVTPRDHRCSLESVPLHAASAPQHAGSEDSDVSDSNCFELNKASNSSLGGDEVVDAKINETSKSIHANKQPSSREKKVRSPSSLQVRFEEQMAWAMSCNEDKKLLVVDKEQRSAGHENQTELSSSQGSKNVKAIEEGSHERRTSKHEESHWVNPNDVMEKLIRNHMMSESVHSGYICGEASCSYPTGRSQASPVRPWMSKIVSPDISESSTLVSPGLNDNTLKAKLLEARLKGQRSRFKGPS